MKIGENFSSDHRLAILSARNEMNKNSGKRLGHIKTILSPLKKLVELITSSSTQGDQAWVEEPFAIGCIQYPIAAVLDAPILLL